MVNLLFPFVLSVAMETVRFHIDQMVFFLMIFFSHLVGPGKQFGNREKLSWGWDAR